MSLKKEICKDIDAGRGVVAAALVFSGLIGFGLVSWGVIALIFKFLHG